LVNIKTAKEGLVLYGTAKIKDHDFHLKYKTMDNTKKKGTHLRKKAEIWSDEEKQKLWYLYLDNSDLSCLDLAEKVKGSFITELRTQ
jgi:hypothetical protein